METHTFEVGNMDCANCAREVEEGVSRLEGVEWVQVNFSTSKMTIRGDYDLPQLRQRVEALGKTLNSSNEQNVATAPPFFKYLLGRQDTRLSLIGSAIVLPVFLLDLAFNLPTILPQFIYTLAMLVALWPIARSGWRNLLINHRANINFLMTIAAIGAVVIGEFLEAYVVIALFALGEALEGYAVSRARQSVTSLLKLQPDNAIRLENEKEFSVPVAALAIGDHILVRPGDRVPVDGFVVSGISAIDESTITGESMPVTKEDHDPVYAGTLNGNGLLRIEVAHDAGNSTLQHIIRLVEETQNRRAPVERIIDRFAAVYTPLVMIVALLVATIPPLVFGAPFWDQPGQHGWFYRALAMLVIACPCSLVISTPVTIISSITAAARRGVLVKGGDFLEILGRIKVIAFDKTGTLTTGSPVAKTVRSVSCAGNDQCKDCGDLLALAEALERQSLHPLAHAVINAARDYQVADRYVADHVTLIPGGGIQGEIREKQVVIGSHRLINQRWDQADKFVSLIDEMERAGQTTILLYDGEQVKGMIGVSDRPRAEAKSVVAHLHRMGIHTVMLTGDNARVAATIQDEIGVQQRRDGLLPEDKVEEVSRLAQQYDSVGMIGDGVNDTPALAAASVGIAMGGVGSAQALETADVVLMADDLRQVPYLIGLAQFARRLIRQNISLTLVIKLIFLMLAIAGLTSLWLAILADVGMSLLVTFNGMRPLRYQSA